MAVLADIARAWRDPRGLIREKVVEPREDRALATLMGACALLFVAQWPEMARLSHVRPEVPLDARVGGSLMALIFVLPLVLYLLTWVIWLVGRAFHGGASAFAVRYAMFQSLLAASPLFLANGLVRGMNGPGAGAIFVGALTLIGFLWLFLNMLMAVEREAPDV